MSVTAPIQTASVMLASAQLFATMGIGYGHRKKSDGQADVDEVSHAR
jgi:hypothetical protein